MIMKVCPSLVVEGGRSNSSSPSTRAAAGDNAASCSSDGNRSSDVIQNLNNYLSASSPHHGKEVPAGDSSFSLTSQTFESSVDGTSSSECFLGDTSSSSCEQLLELQQQLNQENKKDSCLDTNEQEEGDGNGKVVLRSRPRRSILRSSTLPDLESSKLQKPESSSANDSSSSKINNDENNITYNPKQLRRSASSSVRFGEVHIRRYAQTVGDNPSVSFGCPITLDWDFEVKKPTPVNDYEEKRAPHRRNANQLTLNSYHRRNLLSWKFGHSPEELAKAEAKANKTKRERAMTLVLLPTAKVEEVLHSAVRKTKRFAEQQRRRRRRNSALE